MYVYEPLRISSIRIGNVRKFHVSPGKGNLIVGERRDGYHESLIGSKARKKLRFGHTVVNNCGSIADRLARVDIPARRIKRPVRQSRNKKSGFDLQVDDSIVLFSSGLKVQETPRNRNSRMLHRSVVRLLCPRFSFRCRVTNASTYESRLLPRVERRWTPKLIKTSSCTSEVHFHSPRTLIHCPRSVHFSSRRFTVFDPIAIMVAADVLGGNKYGQFSTKTFSRETYTNAIIQNSKTRTYVLTIVQDRSPIFFFFFFFLNRAKIIIAP